MKFLQSEYQSIKATIDAAGLEYAAFDFSKKRGKVHITHRPTKSSFVFFRKKETVLTVKKEFEETVSYHLFAPEKLGPFPDWNAVLKNLESWLSSLPQT